MATILWMGPVSAANLSSVKLPQGFGVVTINKGIAQRAPTPGGPPPEIGSDAFRALGASFGKDPISALLQQGGRGNDNFVLLASFSAGHGLLEYILTQQPEDPRLSGVLAADSYYLSQGDSDALRAKPGFASWGLRSIKTGAPLWLTSSTTAGANYPSGTSSILGLSTALQLSTRVPPSEMPAPVACKGRPGPDGGGGVFWLDYGAKFSHVQHATTLAPQALGAWLGDVGPVQGPTPGGSSPQPGKSSGGDDALPIALIAAALYTWGR